jgi:hypothetical protein
MTTPATPTFLAILWTTALTVIFLFPLHCPAEISAPAGFPELNKKQVAQIQEQLSRFKPGMTDEQLWQLLHPFPSAVIVEGNGPPQRYSYTFYFGTQHRLFVTKDEITSVRL